MAFPSIASVSPGMPTTRFTTFTPGSSTESNTTTSCRFGSRNAGRRAPTTGTSAPYSALLTNRKSPMSSVFSILPDGMRNASTRRARRKNQITSAAAMDFTHSQVCWDSALACGVGVVGVMFTFRICLAWLRPLGHEYVRLSRDRPMPIGGKDQLGAVWREHWEPVEVPVRGDLHESRTVHVHEVEIEVAGPWILVVRREDDPPAVGMEIRCEVGPAEVRDLPLVRAVRVHDPQLHMARPDQVFGQEGPVVRRVLRRLRVERPIHDLAAVRRKERATVVSQCGREPPYVAAIHVHRVDVEIPIPRGREHDVPAIDGHRRLGIVARRLGEPGRSTAIGVGGIEVVLV